VDTDMSAAALAGQEREKILASIPLGRPGTAEEIAGGVLFLASELADYCCGEILNINGGSVPLRLTDAGISGINLGHLSAILPESRGSGRALRRKQWPT
jgi:hypothetical protein